MDKNLHAGHRDRLKKRFLAEGVDAFDDHQLLEMLLFYALPRKDTNELAHKLLVEYGSLAGLCEAAPQDIAARCAVTLNTAILLSLLPAIARRYFQDKWKGKPLLNCPEKAGTYAKALFVGRTYEAFYLICLNTQNCVNHAALVHKGTINEAPVYPRVIVEKALRHQATAVILAHNHPGGSLQPSSADVSITKRIVTALSSIAVQVNDHIIVAGEHYFSFAEHGLL